MSFFMRQLIVISMVILATSTTYFKKESYDESASTLPFETYTFEENKFSTWSTEELKKFFSLKVSEPSLKTLSKEKKYSGMELPETFDSRQEWADCVRPIRDQQKCGSCWAFAATGSMADRKCIATRAEFKEHLSPQHCVTCDYSNFGCSGGNLFTSHFFLKWFGTVTDECFPYTSGDGNSGHCKIFSWKCANPEVPYIKHKASNWHIYTSAEAMKEAIVQGGSIVTGFMVYEDFLQYKGGIYKRTSDKMLGGHAVKIIGWGADHWICENSWNKSWGEDGYFRIGFGEANIDALTVSTSFK